MRRSGSGLFNGSGMVFSGRKSTRKDNVADTVVESLSFLSLRLLAH